MAWNSQPQGLTAAQQQAGTQINPINMQGVVAAILEHQQMQQRQQQIQQQQIQQGLGEYVQQYEQQQHDDLANRAIYQAKYPGDPYTGQEGYDSRVPDYGGTAGLKMQQIEAQLGNQGLNTDLLKAKINAEQALGYDRYTFPNHAGMARGNPELQQQKEQRIAAQAELDAAKRSYSSATGVPTRDLSKAEDALNSYKAGETAFPAIGSHKAVSDASEGAYKDSVLSARDQYKSALAKIQGLNSSPQSAGQHGPPAGTQGIVNGMRAQWDGHGWVAIP